MTLIVFTVIAAAASEVTQRNSWELGVGGRDAPNSLGRGRCPSRGPTPKLWLTAAHTHPGVLHPIPVGLRKRQRERRKAGRRWAYSWRIQGEREGAGNLARGGTSPILLEPPSLSPDLGGGGADWKELGCGGGWLFFQPPGGAQAFGRGVGSRVGPVRTPE